MLDIDIVLCILQVGGSPRLVGRVERQRQNLTPLRVSMPVLGKTSSLAY